MTKQAVLWMLYLEREHFPIELGRNYPRIVNRLAETWDNPEEGNKYLDSLLLDDRGNRQGFPMKVLRELIALRELYNALHHDMRDLWNKARLIRPIGK